jgi:glycine dehydrogenase subunit 1
MDVANASVYDGASGLAEAVLMAVRANKKAGSRNVLVTGATHPLYVETARNIVRNQGIEIEVVAFGANGVTTLSAMQQASQDPVAVIVQQPNFFGMLEDADALTDWASSRGALVIGVTNPLSLALFEPPSCWGEHGADIVCGDGQPLGIPMSSGGPSFGFICAKRALVRQMPGRIIGATEDTDGQRGYTLTLQAREQHIRRAKATSNICTNQGLLVTAATIHMSLLGPSGLRNVAVASHNRTRQLVDRLTEIEGVERIFEGPYFHEQALSLGRGAAEVVETLAGKGWVAGLALGAYFPDLADACLFCATEQRTVAEIDAFAADLGEVLA